MQYTVPASEKSCPGWWTLGMNIMAVQNNSLSRTIIINYNFNWHVIGSQNVLLIIAYRWTAVYQTAFFPVAELLMKRTVVTRTDYYPVTLVQVHNFLCTCTLYNAYLNIAQQCEFLFYGRSTLTDRVWRANTKSRIFSVIFSRHFPAQFGGVLSHSLPIYDFFSDIKSVQYLVIIFTWHICRGVQPVSLDCSMAHHSILRQ